MTRPKGALRAWLLAAALTTSTAVSVGANTLFQRDDTCKKCPQAGFPDNFCCPTGSSCIPLAGGTTVLCCPEGSDCKGIQSITCEIEQQNPATHPDALVKTTALKSKLPTCGDNCCPFGYTCQDGECHQDADQTKKPASAADQGSSASSASSTPSSTATSTKASASSTTAPSASATKSSDAHATSATAAAPDAEHGDPAEGHAVAGQTSAIVGGVVGGVLLVIILAVAFLYVYRRRKAEERRRRDSDRSFVSKGALNISAPMEHKQYNHGRTDFAMKTTSARTTPSQAQEGFQPDDPFRDPRSYSIAETERSIDDGAADERSYHPSAIIRGLRSSNDISPTSRRSYGDDFEDINIFADPTTVNSGTGLGVDNRRDTTMTRWTRFQRAAN